MPAAQLDVTKLTSHAQAAPAQAIHNDVVSLRTKSPVVWAWYLRISLAL
jgi:hypothetical protein